MSTTARAEVARFRYVHCMHEKGHTYYYFRRRPFPIVRLPGEPGSEVFTTVYNFALRATTRDQFAVLRSNMKQMPPRKVESPLTTAMWAWANRKPITYSQASMVAKRFGLPVEDIVRDRQVVGRPENEVLTDPQDCKSFGNADASESTAGSTPVWVAH